MKGLKALPTILHILFGSNFGMAQSVNGNWVIVIVEPRNRVVNFPNHITSLAGFPFLRGWWKLSTQMSFTAFLA